MRYHVSDTCGHSVQGALVYSTAVPFNQWSIPQEQQTGSDGWAELRMQRLDPVLAGREWLVADRFSVADIAMAEVLRIVGRFNALADFPGCAAYVARAVARPAFVKAHSDQMAHFAAGDKARG